MSNNNYPLDNNTLYPLNGYLYGSINNSPDTPQSPPNVGSSGTKKYNFPTSPNESPENYPDISQDVKMFKSDVENTISQTSPLQIYSLFADKFKPGGDWDTKASYALPGVDADNKEQYARYQGQIVPGSQIANNVYGSAAQAAGMPLEQAMTAAQLATLYGTGKLDQPEDQWSIVSGYADRQYKNPWRYGTYSNSNPAQTNDPIKSLSAYRKENPYSNPNPIPLPDPMIRPGY
jgi:hypothetical protein